MPNLTYKSWENWKKSQPICPVGQSGSNDKHMTPTPRIIHSFLSFLLAPPSPLTATALRLWFIRFPSRFTLFCWFSFFPVLGKGVDRWTILQFFFTGVNHVKRQTLTKTTRLSKGTREPGTNVDGLITCARGPRRGWSNRGCSISFRFIFVADSLFEYSFRKGCGAQEILFYASRTGRMLSRRR